MQILRRIRNLGFSHFSHEYRFSEQYAYGHREILLEAAGLTPDTPIYGRVQHGWDPLLVDPTSTFRPFVLREAWQWVWTSENEALGRLRGVKKVKAIGAPWLYLLDQHDVSLFQPNPYREAGRLLLMPSHLNEMSSIDFHKLQIGQALSYASVDSWTVMLHGLDFMTKAIRDLYTDAGFFITTAGWPAINQGARSPSSSIGDRTKYLENIYQVMRNVEVLLTDDVGTHILYASSLGVDVLVKPISLDLMFGSAPERVEEIVRQGRLFREWQEESSVYNSGSMITPDMAAEIAAGLLGLNSKLDPPQLRAALLAR